MTEIKFSLKILVRKNLKMSTGKTAAQSVHAALGLMRNSPHNFPDGYTKCVVLEVSDKKFEEAKVNGTYGLYITTDAGYTEVPPGTQTALAFWEPDPN